MFKALDWPSSFSRWQDVVKNRRLTPRYIPRPRH